MKIKWIKRRSTTAKSQFIYLSPKGPICWKDVGDVVEVDDEIGYRLLERDPDILQRVTEKIEVKKKVRRGQKAPRNKMMKSYEDK